MKFEVRKKHGRGWRRLGLFTAQNSVLAAQQARDSYGGGLYAVQPEDAKNCWVKHRMHPKVRRNA